MTDKYILDEDGNPEPCDDLRKWAMWFENADRTVGHHKEMGVEVSTVFLGLKHGDCLYETMVFGGKLDQEQERHVTKKEAAEAHINMVERVRNQEKEIR